MNQGKKAMKIFVIFMLSLTLTAGYVQALPDLSSFGYRSASTASFYDLISSKLPGIFGKSPAWDIPSNSDLPPFNYISKSEAISIAKGLWPTAIWSGNPKAQLKRGVWTVTLTGYTKDWEGDCPDGYYCIADHLGGDVKINANTGEIISIRHLK